MSVTIDVVCFKKNRSSLVTLLSDTEDDIKGLIAHHARCSRQDFDLRFPKEFKTDVKTSGLTDGDMVYVDFCYKVNTAAYQRVMRQMKKPFDIVNNKKLLEAANVEVKGHVTDESNNVRSDIKHLHNNIMNISLALGQKSSSSTEAPAAEVAAEAQPLVAEERKEPEDQKKPEAQPLVAEERKEPEDQPEAPALVTEERKEPEDQPEAPALVAEWQLVPEAPASAPEAQAQTDAAPERAGNADEEGDSYSSSSSSGEDDEDGEDADGNSSDSDDDDKEKQGLLTPSERGAAEQAKGQEPLGPEPSEQEPLGQEPSKQESLGQEPLV